MKKKLAIILFLCTSQLFAGFGLGGDVNYISMSQVSTATGHFATTTSAAGYVILPYIRYYIPLGNVVTIGVGPYLGFGSLSVGSLSSSLNYETLSLFRVGGDLIFTLNPSPDIKPYVRIMVGKDFIEDTTSLKTSPSETLIVAGYGTLQWNVLFGVKLYLNDVLSLYLQGGIAGSPDTAVAVKSLTGPGASASLSSTLNSLNTKVNYTGAIFGLGMSFEF